MSESKKPSASSETSEGRGDFRFHLAFQDRDGELALYTIELEDQVRGTRNGLFRGLTVPPGGNWSPFHWSKAVRALAVLMVRRAAFGDDPVQSTLSGARGTLASTLDYALAKQPEWLVDLFGADINGRSRLSRLVNIINPSRKRPGPVTISLKPDRVPAASILVQVNGQRSTPEGLRRLVADLETGEPTTTPSTSQPSLDDSGSKTSSPSVRESSLMSRVRELPATPSQEQLSAYLKILAAPSAPIIAIEDDAGGLQLSASIPSVLEHEIEDLQWLIHQAQKVGIGFATHPSRGQDARGADQLFYSSARRLAQISRQEGIPIRWAARFDSCLRGHNLAEMSAIKRALVEAGTPPFDLEVYAPAFYQAGRITIDGFQLLRVGETYVPVSETEYARLPGFEYSTSDVAAVIDRTAPKESFYRLICKTLRTKPPELIVDEMLKLPAETRVVVDSVDEHDSIPAAYVFRLLESRGKRILYRSAPSLLLSMLGRRPSPQLDPGTIQISKSATRGPGLIVAGSLSGLTKQQLRATSERDDIILVPVDPAQVMQARASHIRAVTKRALSLIKGGFTPLLTTRLWEDSSVIYPTKEERNQVLDSLAEIVRNLEGAPSWLLLKGSDTCLHVLRWGARANRFEIIGRFLSGGSLGKVMSESSPWHAKPIVLFPGNVGDEFAVSSAIEVLTERLSAN